jgi:Radical SAM superfamily
MTLSFDLMRLVRSARERVSGRSPLPPRPRAGPSRQDEVKDPAGSPDAEIVAVEHEDPSHAKIVLVDWMLGNSCNYSCSYCPAALHDGSTKWQTLEAIVATMDKLSCHYTDRMGRRVWLQFTGGEPTQHPKFFDIMRESRSRGFSQSVISNGSRTLRFWRRAVEVLDAAILTFHDEFADPVAFLDLAVLLSERIPLHINVTMHPDRFDAILETVQTIADAAPNTSMTLKPLRLDFGTELYDYAPEQLRTFSRRMTPGPGRRATPRGVMAVRSADGTAQTMRANDFLIAGENRWTGWECRAGLESLRIHGTGEVTRAVCGSGGPLGNVAGTLDLPFEPIRCDRRACGCVADILITKRKPEQDRDRGQWPAREPPHHGLFR